MPPSWATGEMCSYALVQPSIVSTGESLSFIHTLFLDFDGVLNNEPFLRQMRSEGEMDRLFDPVNIEAFDGLCEAVSVSEVIISSSWRKGRTVRELQTLLEQNRSLKAGLVRGVTPEIGERGDEIVAWLERNPRESFLVVDDFPLEEYFPDRFLRTSTWVGLSPSAVEEWLDRKLKGS